MFDVEAFERVHAGFADLMEGLGGGAFRGFHDARLRERELEYKHEVRGTAPRLLQLNRWDSTWTEADRTARLDKERTKAAKKYTPPDPVDSDGFPDLPEGWLWVSLDDLAFIDVGFAFPSKGFVAKGVKLVRGANVAPGGLDWSDTKYWPPGDVDAFAHLALAEGDTILAMDRPVISTGLKLARVTSDDLPSLLVQRVARFNMVADQLSDLLHYMISSLRFISHLTSNQTGSDLPHVSATDVGRYPIPLPPLAELEVVCDLVGEFIGRLNDLASKVAGRLDTLDTLRQAALARAFRGELVPTDAELARRSVGSEQGREEPQAALPS